MNKKELTKIYKQLAVLRNSDKQTDKALRNFLKTIAADTRNHTYIEKDSFYGATEILETIYGKHFADDISYWFYEVCESRRDTVLKGTDKDGKVYTFNTLSNYLDFVIATADYAN